MNMKTTQILTLTVLAVVFSTTVFAEEKPSDTMLLIGRPNSALAGVREVSVVITTAGSEPNMDVALADLRAKVIGRLYDAGFAVSRSPAGHILTGPELRINIDMLKLESCEVCVLSVQTSLARGVALPDNGRLHIGADVWKAESGLRSVATEKMSDEVSSIVQEQIQAFVTACPVAGAGDKQSDVNQTRLQPRKTATEKNTKPAKQQAVESSYVASKNGEVFHRPGCQSAGKILPENLVTYSTREEAIDAGKRPCKRCNP
jgi:hypothetical protein